MKEELYLQSQSNPILSQLHAERALNRELISLNIDLQHKLINIENKLLEIIKIPLNERKQLVCDVLLERENEIMKLRRENRTLKEQIHRLENIFNEVYQGEDKKIRNIKDDGVEEDEEEEGEGEEGEEDHRYLHDKFSSTSRYNGRIRTKQVKGQSYESSRRRGKELLSLDERYSNPTSNLNKKDALKIIIHELRTLQQQNKDLISIKQLLSKQLYDETCRYQQQTLALQVIQQQYINIEKKYQDLITRLIKKYNEHEIYDIIDMIENGGV